MVEICLLEEFFEDRLISILALEGLGQPCLLVYCSWLKIRPAMLLISSVSGLSKASRIFLPADSINFSS
jgi:hypothetical protein